MGPIVCGVVAGMNKIPRFDLGRFDAVAIASSTGGPCLVEQIVTGLPADLPVPIFIAQHMPPEFTETFSARLDLNSPLTVVHAEDDMRVFAGTAYLGRGHQHMRVCGRSKQTAKIEISKEPEKLVFKPSADELFRSCAKVYGSSTLAIIMTGIGRDGTDGAGEIREAGGMVLTQIRESCVVYGMPRSCEEAGFSDAQLTVDQIRRTILQLSPDHHEKAIA